mgnify:CR=1 FL=1
MRIVALFALTCLALSIPAHGEVNSSMLGFWETPEGDAKIEILDCGDGTPCGDLVWVNPASADAETDINNPEKALRNRSLVGIRMVWGFKLLGDKWRSGKVYDPESGRTYRAELTLVSANQLKLKGCFGPICRSQIWTRAIDP